MKGIPLASSASLKGRNTNDLLGNFARFYCPDRDHKDKNSDYTRLVQPGKKSLRHPSIRIFNQRSLPTRGICAIKDKLGTAN